MILRILAIILFSIFSANASEKIYYIGVEGYIDHPFQSLKDILDSFAREEGLKFEYIPHKSEDLYKKFLSGELDFKFPDNHIWKSELKVHHKIYYSDIVTHYIDGIFVKKSDISKKMRDIKVFGTNKGEDLDPILARKQKKGKIKVEGVKSCSELISKLENGEIEAIFCNYDVMRYLLKDSLLDKEIVFNPDLLYIDNSFYFSTIKYPEIIEKFNKWIEKNRRYIENLAHEKN